MGVFSKMLRTTSTLLLTTGSDSRFLFVRYMFLNRKSLVYFNLLIFEESDGYSKKIRISENDDGEGYDEENDYMHGQ